jgi:hypothetical protein
VAEREVVEKGERREREGRRESERDIEEMGEWGGTEEGNREGHGTRKSGLMSRRLERRRLGQAREQPTRFRHYCKSSSAPCSGI